MRLLIVEDEVRLADTLRQLLNRQGYTADVYYDGVSGLDNATTGIYDLMVLDVMLPGMVVPKETLLTRVWGAESDAEDNNAEAYISFLRKKLHFLGSRVGIATLRKVGYRLEVSA